MPKTPINYDETCIYKLISKDPDITETYIGHTTRLVKRKAEHKSKCNNPNDKRHNVILYQYIRANGGWDNFNIIMVEKFACKDKHEAEAREQYYITLFHSKLNSQYASRTKKEYSEQNKDKIADYHKIWWEQNKDEINEKKKRTNDL